MPSLYCPIIKSCRTSNHLLTNSGDLLRCHTSSGCAHLLPTLGQVRRPVVRAPVWITHGVGKLVFDESGPRHSLPGERQTILGLFARTVLAMCDGE
jgi:hypothetical protein